MKRKIVILLITMALMITTFCLTSCGDADNERDDMKNNGIENNIDSSEERDDRDDNGLEADDYDEGDNVKDHVEDIIDDADDKAQEGEFDLDHMAEDAKNDLKD